MIYKEINKKIKCPYCRKCYCMELSVIQTAAYYPRIYKDGVNINPNKNIVTKQYRCLECSKIFEVKE